MPELSVIAIDVGAPRNIGWWRIGEGSPDTHGRDLDGAVTAVADDLLVWEAFVTKDAKDRGSLDPHVDDARVAVRAFERRWRAGAMASDIDEPLVLNLVAAGLLASGLTDDVSLLGTACLVVRPGAPGTA